MRSALKRAIDFTAVSLLVSLAIPATAAVPDGINYQGYLTNIGGAPVNTDVSITFAAYNVDVGGVPLWSQTDLVPVDRGLFSVTLGSPGNPFPTGMFSGPVYIGLFVAGEEMLPRRQLTSVAYAFLASDADTLNGVTAAALDQSADVGSLQSDVGALQTTTSTNDSRITTLEGVGADITAVNAGSGLSGGGSSGDITVNVAALGIDASMIAPNAVTSGAIADGQVTSADIADSSIVPADINAAQSFTFGGATIDGVSTLNNRLDLNGALTVESSADIRIIDNFNGFRWYDLDGTTELASITVRASNKTFRDTTHNNIMVYSNANGIGIGTTNPSAAYDVTMPSLSVTGQTSVGLERVSATYDLDSTSSNCHSHGNLACFYGSGSVSCPVGKRALGGGASGSSGLFGSISRSNPTGSTSWSCAASYDISGSSRTCYVICARLE